MTTYFRMDFDAGNNKPQMLSDKTQSTLGKDSLSH